MSSDQELEEPGDAVNDTGRSSRVRRQVAAAWSGNAPLTLASFYTDDLFYSDPTRPDGVSGKQEFIRYLSKLLANNPHWVWTQESAIPPQMSGHLIYRNEVYLDTLPLITAIRSWNGRKMRDESRPNAGRER